LWDALVLPDGAEGVEMLAQDGRAAEFVKDQYRHCKPILVLGASMSLFEGAGASAMFDDGTPDPGVVVVEPRGDAGKGAKRFIEALARHRHWQREKDPPAV
jgi:catalase